MLGKLLKHEFRATGRIMLPLIAAELLISVLAGLSVRGLARMEDMSFLHTMYVMTLFVFGLGLFAVAVVAFVLMIQRFYRSLLQDEGYLSMTLPVSVDAHIWAKLITSFVWFVAVGLLSIAASLVVMTIGAAIELPPFFAGSWEEFAPAFDEIGGGNLALYLLETAVLAFLAGGAVCLRCYASMAIGCSASDHKLLLSFVTYIAVSIVLSILSNAAAFTILPNLNVEHMLSGMSQAAAMHAVMGVYLLISAALFALFYYLTRYFLKNKLNLA